MKRHQPRKRFGQHFLVDDAVIERIVRAIAPARDDVLIEIGPGLAALTWPLLRHVERLRVIELDRDLAGRLRRQAAKDQLVVVEDDALRVDFAQFGTGLRIVGNLPYNISTPLLFHLMKFADIVVDQHFMLQREVVDRMVAGPGDPANGRLAIMLQSRFAIEKLFDVPPDAFDPPPKVMSAVVRMKPLPEARRPRPMSDAAFAYVVQQAFAQRRKMLRRSLGDWARQIDWDALAIPATARAEELGVDEFVRLADALVRAGVFADADISLSAPAEEAGEGASGACDEASDKH